MCGEGRQNPSSCSSSLGLIAVLLPSSSPPVPSPHPRREEHAIQLYITDIPSTLKLRAQ